ncbi:SDR family oxidoreductase [Chroococcidiopsis sp. FACHB-1243]|uniref:SDR family NAD(P)-dependent oxidoreductase n=1 Tax=Chroococcidiopsis sp. [FACHB-1243] TaxID=2692781 RepID=UPI001781D3E7|nr:SDR family oxidoreductase [Chroococcidiopsis sp. [FACHB-1243]]MBD2306722.1 SDR family oxidoreductase [Chroococcidiopsis sp. [FACHB-1243]]
MDLQLRDKRALITGSSSGIGEGIAKVLAQEGAIVVIHGRKEEQANRVAQEINSDGGKAVVAIGDLSTDEGAHQTADKALQSLGGVDILVNCAGMFLNRGWMDTPTDGWLQMYNANVVSMVRMIRLLVPQMKELGWGRIIQIASTEATQPFANMPDYAATKAAILNLTVSLSKELAQTGVTINSISPGIVRTSGLESFFRETAAIKGWGTDWAEIEKNVLKEVWYNQVGRLARVEDIANLVAYVASPLADFINSANLRVDGGGTSTVN